MAEEKWYQKFLGTGLAKGAADKLSGRQLQLKKQECKATGGTWDEKQQRCIPAQKKR